MDWSNTRIRNIETMDLNFDFINIFCSRETCLQMVKVT
jgi:hypothetical protein